MGIRLAAYGTHYAKVNPWMRGATTRQTGRVVRADSMVPFDQLAKTEFYTDFLRPQELQSGIGVTLMRESLRAGVLRVGIGRKVRAASKAAEELLKASTELSIDRNGHLQCRRAAVVDYVDSVLSGWLRADSAAGVRSFLLLAGEAGMPMRLTGIPPVHKPEEAFFRGPECIVLLESPGGNVGFAAREFGALYGLSAAETRVVAGLAHGRTPAEIAAHGRIAVDTVRKQIKSIFLRTGLSRQSDIVRSVCLLAGTVLNPADDADSE